METIPMKSIEELRQEKMTLCHIEWREEKVWELTRTDTEVSCTIGVEDFANLYLCDKLIRLLKRRKTWIGFMPESCLKAECWKR
jgi:hypothetical protein